MKIPDIPSPSAMLRDPTWRSRLSLGLVVLVALALLSPLVVGRDARHLTAYRDGSEDLSRLRSEFELAGAEVGAILSTPHLLEDTEADRTLLVIIGNERRYGASEAQAVVAFLERGGRVLLADETGFGTDVARAAGLAFASQRVLDTQNFRGDPALGVATARVDGTPYRVVFNAPTTIVPLPNARPHEVLARSSAAAYPDGSYLDVNANGEIDVADQPGPFPLVVQTRVGAGTLVLVADTGVFMNAQLGLADYENAAFARALFDSLLPEQGVALFEESRHAPTALVAAWQGGMRALARVTAGPIAPLVTVPLLALAAFVAWRLTRQTEDWSHHDHDVAQEVPLPEDVRPDLARIQRMSRRRISESFNMPMEQVSAMTTDELLAVCGDRSLAEAASGALRTDPAPLFRTFSSPSPDTPPEAIP